MKKNPNIVREFTGCADLPDEVCIDILTTLEYWTGCSVTR